ncbi:MAG TPA: ABC transporter ATP-binding protein [Novimethylophilus sp.]|jgi:multiple sugar transport system ATP-binding protein|uniref:ABC transporter ATP-binding protein n=1 Tax=Novimethylophilus sp. TaxID=2137426 RepID=UPI002F3F1D2B
MANVSIRNLSVSLGDNEIINNLDLDVTEGEFLVLLGPSGCGKSTLLHSIAGLNEVADGTIEIGGQDMTWADPSQRNIGMVFQSYALYPTMTVERNMSFALRIKGMPAAEIEHRVRQAAEILHLEPLLKRKPSQLSGGQCQRVAIGRALVREAGVFLFDEPLSNLDAKLRTELRRELKLLHKRLRSTMIYVTHDQVDAMTLANRIVVMRNGCILQIGAPSEVYEKPENLFVAGFLGTPGMNFINGKLAVTAGTTAFVAMPLNLDLSGYAFRQPPTAGRAVTLGIRPEHIRIVPQGSLQGVICLVEPMGNHQIVWIDCCGNMISSIVHGVIEYRPDQPVRFDIDGSKASLFDQAGEQRL